MILGVLLSCEEDKPTKIGRYPTYINDQRRKREERIKEEKRIREREEERIREGYEEKKKKDERIKQEEKKKIEERLKGVSNFEIFIKTGKKNKRNTNHLEIALNSMIEKIKENPAISPRFWMNQ